MQTETKHYLRTIVEGNVSKMLQTYVVNDMMAWFEDEERYPLQGTDAASKSSLITALAARARTSESVAKSVLEAFWKLSDEEQHQLLRLPNVAKLEAWLTRAVKKAK
jgi:hypothetical protein